MSQRIELMVNAALSAAGRHGYSAKYVPSDDEMDDAVNILLHGAETSWSLQLGTGYTGLNEYGYENGSIAWVRDHGYFPTRAAAIAKLCAMLETIT